MPLVGAGAVVGVDAKGVTAVGGGHGGVGDGRAEESGEGFVSGLVQVVLVAEEDDLVGEERGADLGDDIATELPIEPHTPDLGTDPPTDPGDGELGTGGSAHGNSLGLVSVVEEGRTGRPVGRGPWAGPVDRGRGHGQGQRCRERGRPCAG